MHLLSASNLPVFVLSSQLFCLIKLAYTDLSFGLTEKEQAVPDTFGFAL